LKAVYPEQEWKGVQPRIAFKPKGYWRDIKNQRAFFDQLAKKLDISKPADWYHISAETVQKLGGAFVHYQYNDSLVKGKLCRNIETDDLYNRTDHM
jgi:hypothetical protein